MIPPVIFPDVRKSVIDGVRAALAGRPEPVAANVYVGGDVPPQDRRTRMVTARLDGGARLDGARESVRLGINVWATSESDAHDLAQLVRAILWALPDGKPIVAITDSSGPYVVPDQSTQPHMYLSVEVIVRGAAFDPSLSGSSES